MVRLREESKRSLSPDRLGVYIRVSKPSVWLLLALIAVLLAAGIVWFFAGSIVENVMGTAVSDGEGVVAYVSLEDSAKLHEGDAVVLTAEDGAVRTGSVAAVADMPVAVDCVLQAGAELPRSLEEERWACVVSVDASLEPGSYEAAVEVASHRPIMMLLGLD